MAYKRITKPPSIKRPNTFQVIVISFIQRMLELYPANQGMVRVWDIGDYTIAFTIGRYSRRFNMCGVHFHDDYITFMWGDDFRKYHYCDPDYEDLLVARIKECEVFLRGRIRELQP